MALVLDGTTQYAHKAKATDLSVIQFAVFAYVKRSALNQTAAVFGTDMDSGNRRNHGIKHDWTDPDNSVAFELYIGTEGTRIIAPFPADEWVPVLYQKPTADATTQPWDVYVGNSTKIVASAISPSWLDPHTHFYLGAYRDLGVPTSFFDGKLAHWAVWEGVNLSGQDLIDLLDNGAAPSTLSAAPTAYEPLVSSAGSFTTVGSPSFDADDPIASTPETRKGSTFDIETTLGTITTATLSAVNVFDHVTGQVGTTVSFEGAATDEIITSGEYTLTLGDGSSTEDVTVQVNVVGLASFNINKDGADQADLTDVEFIILTGAAGSRAINQQITGITTTAGGDTGTIEITDTALGVDDTVTVVQQSPTVGGGAVHTATLGLI